MKISIITVFPELHESFSQVSLIGRAIEKGTITLRMVRFADFCAPKERIDVPVAGPGAGMILKPEVVERAIVACEQEWGPGYKIFFSPQGIKLTQRYLQSMASQFFGQSTPQESRIETQSISSPHLILVCSRYEGIDARVEQAYADAVISVGDYVVMGGDIPAQIFLEGLLRLLPGVVGTWESVEEESFSGAFLDYPEYGLPVEWKGIKIPEIVQSGNHAAIAQWRTQQACKKTMLKRFDWFSQAQPSRKDCELAHNAIPHHYVALMHTDIQLKDGTIGTTSITSIDLHDIARSCATYGIKNFFMVSPLADQQAIIATFLNFWKSDFGKNYNRSRYHAVGKVKTANGLDDVIQAITEIEGNPPILVATSAKQHAHAQMIDFSCQGTVWQLDRPVLILFGTGQGLCQQALERCDFLLLPVTGLTEYNHLSVRSAAAIVLDRWLGLHPQDVSLSLKANR